MVGEPIEGLIAAVTLTYHRLTLAVDHIHGADALTAGMRSVLLSLGSGGPQTASRLAETRSVSRQFMHRLVQSMIEDGWVAPAPNPHHKRSSLIAPTAKGLRAIKKIEAIETPLFQDLAAGLSGADIKRATTVLERLCERLPASPPDNS